VIAEAAFAVIATILGGAASIHVFSSLVGGSIERTGGYPGGQFGGAGLGAGSK
jgi:hypothetical protein